MHLAEYYFTKVTINFSNLTISGKLQVVVSRLEEHSVQGIVAYAHDESPRKNICQLKF
jgi:hypothetical protein